MTRNLAIKRGIENDLDEQVEKAEEVVERMAELVSDAADALDLPVSDVKLDDAPVTIGGKVFRVTNKNDKAVLAAEKRGKFRRVSTTKGAITFTSNPLQLLSDEFNEFNIHVQNITREIVTKMLGIVLGYTKYLLQIGDITSSLDALLALSHAALASSEPWTKPIFSDKKEIEIEELRHPILESQLVECVPNDVKMSDDRRLMILTGPNMGGKSTFLRSVGLCSLLAQIGSFVPAGVV
jgi:DNA mismatch repair protein MSH2